MRQIIHFYRNQTLFWPRISFAKLNEQMIFVHSNKVRVPFVCETGVLIHTEVEEDGVESESLQRALFSQVKSFEATIKEERQRRASGNDTTSEYKGIILLPFTF